MAKPLASNVPALDGIRGIAILLVVICHYAPRVPGNSVALLRIEGVLSWGWVGVDLFFALSGLLITGILLDTRRASNYFTGFYARRVLRIFPLYYVALSAVLMLPIVVPRFSAVLPLPQDRKLYFVFLTNWLALWKGSWGPNYLGHFWSLAVEEQFYFIWPCCVWLFQPSTLKRILSVGLLLMPLIRILYVWQYGPSVAVFLSTATRMDALLAGALCAFLLRDPALMASIHRLLPAVAVIALVCFAIGARLFRNWDLLFSETIGIPLLALGFSSMVLAAAASNGEATLLQKFLCQRPLLTLGKYSYGVYVLHVPILGLAMLITAKSRGPAVVLFCAFVSTLLAAAVSYQLLERPFLRLKTRFAPQFYTARQDGELCIASAQTRN